MGRACRGSQAGLGRVLGPPGLLAHGHKNRGVELLALDGGGPIVVGIPAVRTGGGGGKEYYDEAET
jgi:hypothetical protein